ncbi:abortive infection system toxin AbiGii family protein [Bacillus cereus group sp. TH217LC]|nr:abortive infection system toxin AbiGii family protein [Bacillus cereus group sp. TH217LC]AYY30531.1 abortive phage resistance protein [Bacillus sp. FDAARGOS_527]MDA1595791.1 abortive infection system toxin AbiGii family protein [Bacillus cereus group sp. TH217LC]
MFSNFRQAFKRDENTIPNIPQEVLEVLSEELGGGLKYVPIDERHVKVVAEEGSDVKFTLSNIKVKLPDGLQLSSPEELQEFLYRTQQIVETDGVSVVINGERKPIAELVKDPFRPKRYLDGKTKFELVPEPFPEPKPLEVAYEEGGIFKVFHVQRQPLADMKKSLFKTVDNGSLEITFIVNEETGSLTFNVNTILSKAKNIEEIIETLKLYIGFINGKVQLAGTIQTPFMNDNEERSVNGALHYWEKVLAISEKLNVKFNPHEEIDEKGMFYIEKLYRSLIEGAPYKIPVNVEDFTTTTSEPLNTSEYIEKDGMAFQYAQEESVKLYGATLTIFSAVALLNCKVTDIEAVEKNKYKFKIEPAYGENIEQAAQHFTNRQELDGLFTPPENALKVLSKAKDLDKNKPSN